MCGRATLVSPVEDVVELFEAPAIDIGPPRFNIAPGQSLLTVRAAREQGRELALLKWGLVPSWAKPEEAKRFGARCLHARAETLASTPAFRDAWKSHRCLVVVDGFYEWKTLADGRRVPHHAKPAASARAPFALAGVWDRSTTIDGEILESCAVVTTPAKGAIAQLHDRMPVVIDRTRWAAWLEGSTDVAKDVLAHGDGAREFFVVPVSPWVNDVRHDDPRCLDRLASANDAPGQIGFAFLDANRAKDLKRS